MKKKVICAGISVSLIGTICTFSASAEVTEKKIDENIFAIQHDACMAHELLCSSFDWDKTYVYPDNFGGDYIDYDTLHILLTDNEAIPYYANLLSEYRNSITFDIVEHSYNEIFNETEKLAEDISDEYNVVSVYVDVEKNKGKIGITAEDYAKITDTKVYSEFTDKELITFEVDDYYCDSEPVMYFEEELRRDNDEDSLYGEVNTQAALKTIIAGSKITCQGNTYTLGGSGAGSNEISFVSCGHGSEQYLYVQHNGQNIGYVTTNQFAHDEYGDFSIIRASNEYGATSEVYTDGAYTMNFTGTMLDPTVGTYIYKYGEKTGMSYGKVTARGIDAWAWNDLKIKGMTKMEIIYGTDDYGNSGAPCRSGGDFCGIQSGFTSANGKLYTIFTPYLYINVARFSIQTS